MARGKLMRSDSSRDFVRLGVYVRATRAVAHQSNDISATLFIPECVNSLLTPASFDDHPDSENDLESKRGSSQRAFVVV